MSIPILNDILRKTFLTGKVVVTRGILDLPQATQMKIEQAVKDFNRFSEKNDPYGEHDFGAVDVDGVRTLWKIEYFDKQCIYGSEDPANPEITTRVLTILLASEY